MKLKKLKWQKSNLKDRNKKIWNLDSKYCILAYCFLKFLLVHGLFFNHMNVCNFNSIHKYTYLLDMNKRDLDFRIPLSNVLRVSHHVVFWNTKCSTHYPNSMNSTSSTSHVDPILYLFLEIPSTNLPPAKPVTPILAEPLTSAPIEDPAGTPITEFHCSTMVRTLPSHLPLSHCGIDALHKTGIGG